MKSLVDNRNIANNKKKITNFVLVGCHRDDCVLEAEKQLRDVNVYGNVTSSKKTFLSSVFEKSEEYFWYFNKSFKKYIK